MYTINNFGEGYRLYQDGKIHLNDTVIMGGNMYKLIFDGLIQFRPL